MDQFIIRGKHGLSRFGKMFSFGAKPATSTPSLFGASSTPAAATTAQSATGFSGFGSAPMTASTFGSQQQPQSTPVQPVSSFAAHPFQYIQQCYDQSSLNYRFRTYFYNRVEGGIVKYSTNKPANISDRLWTQIVNDNPEPKKMIPIIANGFDDLKARAAWQDEQMEAQAAKAKELEARLATLLKKADLETTSQLQQIQKQQLKLVERVLSIMKVFEVVKRTGHRLQPNEVAVRDKIQTLLTKLSTDSPLEPSNLRNMDLHIHALQEANRLDSLQSLKQVNFDDPAALEMIMSVLAEQHKGIKALSEVLIKDAKDLETIRYGYQI